MDISEKRRKLHDYINSAPAKKVKAIYTLVENQIEQAYDHWEDEKFVAKLLKDEKKYLNGTAKTYSVEEVDEMAKATIKKVGKKER
jgi:hypothetical protein